MTDTPLDRHASYLYILLAYFVVWSDLLLGFPWPTPFTVLWFVTVTLKNAVRIAVILYISSSPAFGQVDLARGRALLFRAPTNAERRQAVAVAAMSLGCAAISVTITRLGGSLNPLFVYRAGMAFWLLVPLALISSLSVGYSEEMFFRFFVLDGLTSAGARQTAAAGVSVLIFALSHHAQGLYGILFAAAIAVLYSFLRLKGYRLHALALGHALYDAAILLCVLA
ncbi:MAG: CPBP family intramembrane metalloprotease [Rectinema sp.]|nr:CPBP family intramembrane metalloprotease [Rectinema sp.]